MSHRLVLDASAAVRIVLRDVDSVPLQNELELATMTLVPGIFFSEVASSLWKYASVAGELTSGECVERLSEIDLLVDEVLDDRELMIEALHEAVTHNHPVYDLLYAVLARRTGAAVLTRDRRLADLLENLGIPHAGSDPR